MQLQNVSCSFHQSSNSFHNGTLCSAASTACPSHFLSNITTHHVRVAADLYVQVEELQQLVLKVQPLAYKSECTH
jgi:hypothetical protein